MIWLADPTSGTYTCGYLRIHRTVHDFELWCTHPKDFHLIGRAATLKEAKSLCQDYAKGHQNVA